MLHACRECFVLFFFFLICHDFAFLLKARHQTLQNDRVRLSQRYEAQQQRLTALEADAEQCRAEAELALTTHREACNKHREELSALTRALDIVEAEREKKEVEQRTEMERMKSQHSLEVNRRKFFNLKRLPAW